MTSVNTLPYSSPPCFFNRSSSSAHKFPQNSFSTERRRSCKTKTLTNCPIRPSSLDLIDDSDQNLKLVLDITQLSKLPSSKFHKFVSLTQDAIHGLKTLITLDESNRLVFSCQKSTLQFTGTVLLSGFLLVSSIMVLVKLVLRRKSKFGDSRDPNFVVRRDRSLGGKEVIVAVNGPRSEESKRPKRSVNALEISGQDFVSGFERDDWRRYLIRSQQKLPKWWPSSGLGSRVGRFLESDQEEEYKREINRLIRAITDHRTTGKDVMEHDIIQLRRICRASGVQASFNSTNTLDAIYRTSIDYVLNVCSRGPSYSSDIEIDGEDPRQFVAWLAENIGLESIRAARMVSGAVAARTRSCFLLAWALDVQGKHSEAMFELSKICHFLQTFPPGDSSPEMEMVARGVARNLKQEQRELLMNMFVGVCGKESHRSAADALGLMPSPEGVGDQ